MNTEEEFHVALVNDPESIELKLVYVDWLDENGKVWKARFWRAVAKLVPMEWSVREPLGWVCLGPQEQQL